MENTDEHAQIPNTQQHTTHPIIADEQIIPYTNKATALGLTFSTRSITPQITTRRAMAMRTLNRLQRFRSLSTNNKRRLYKTIIRPQLLYPIIPLNTISHSSYRKLQQVQNKALRFIGVSDVGFHQIRGCRHESGFCILISTDYRMRMRILYILLSLAL